MIIAQVADPLRWDRWPEARALLEPAAERGNLAEVIEPDEALLVIFDGDDLLGCATVWESTLGYFEVKLIGGREHRRWIAQLDDVIGAAAKRAGARRLLAIGRRGWMRSIERLGWAKISETHGNWVYAREL